MAGLKWLNVKSFLIPDKNVTVFKSSVMVHLTLTISLMGTLLFTFLIEDIVLPLILKLKRKIQIHRKKKEDYSVPGEWCLQETPV